MKNGKPIARLEKIADAEAMRARLTDRLARDYDKAAQDAAQVTVDDVVTACANNAARIEQLAQRLGVGTGRGWYCDTAAIVKCMTGMPREVLVELAEQYGAALSEPGRGNTGGMLLTRSSFQGKQN